MKYSNFILHSLKYFLHLLVQTNIETCEIYNVTMLQKIDEGLDNHSLLGTCIVSNRDYIFVSANGHNIYNGAITIFEKNKLTKHSVIFSPESLNSNFGIKMVVNDRFLIVSAISYNIYEGIIYVYENVGGNWIQNLKIHSIVNKSLNGFGENILLVNEGKQLIVTDFLNNIYQYHFDDETHRFIHASTFRLTEMPMLKTHFAHNVKMAANESHLFLTNNTNILTIYDINNTFVSYIEIQNVENCFNVHFGNNQLFIPCVRTNAFNKIYVFNTKTFLLVQTILGRSDEQTFGNNIVVEGNNMIVSGESYVHHYINKNNWAFESSYFVSSNTVVDFDYTLNWVNDKQFVVGNYGYNDLQGAVFTGTIASKNADEIVQKIANLGSKNIQQNKIFVLTFVLTFGLSVALFVIMMAYLCVSIIMQPSDKKKKEKEEEYSPYKVHSYLGYNETDEYQQQPANSFMQPPFYSQPAFYPTHYNMQPYYFQPFFVNSPYTHYEYPDDKKKQQCESKETVVGYKESVLHDIKKII